jgi:hypothetical protein
MQFEKVVGEDKAQRHRRVPQLCIEKKQKQISLGTPVPIACFQHLPLKRAASDAGLFQID